MHHTAILWRKTFLPRQQPHAAPIPFFLLVFLVVIGIGLMKADSEKSVCTIKGAIGPSGEHIYYLPTHENYPTISATRRSGEQWFCSEWEAWFSGWHKAKG